MFTNGFKYIRDFYHMNPNRVVQSVFDTAYAQFGRERFNVVSGAKMTHILTHCGTTLLDVGCGPGAYLQALHMKGIQADGVEGNPLFAEQAAECGAKIFIIDLDQSGLSEISEDAYDTVIALDVIEHLHSPEKVLKEMVRVAKKNILISVPAEAPPELSGLGFVYASYQDPTHLRYYTPESLHKLLRDAGVFNISISPVFRVKPLLTHLFSPRWYPILNLLNRLLAHFITPQADWSVLLAVGYKNPGH